MANWEKVVTDAQAGGNNYETITTHKRYGSMTSSTWRGTTQTGSTGTTQIWGLSTGVTPGSMPINYMDTSMSAWVGIQFAMYLATSNCKVVKWGSVGHQNNCTKDIRLGLWKGTKVTSDETNHSGYTQGVDFIGYIDYDANADSNTIHAYRECVSLNATAATLIPGDMLYIFATEQPSETDTDSLYWHITNSVRIQHTDG
jgi:hypothetical protein